MRPPLRYAALILLSAGAGARADSFSGDSKVGLASSNGTTFVCGLSAVPANNIRCGCFDPLLNLATSDTPAPMSTSAYYTPGAVPLTRDPSTPGQALRWYVTHDNFLNTDFLYVDSLQGNCSPFSGLGVNSGAGGRLNPRIAAVETSTGRVFGFASAAQASTGDHGEVLVLTKDGMNYESLRTPLGFTLPNDTVDNAPLVAWETPAYGGTVAVGQREVGGFTVRADFFLVNQPLRTALWARSVSSLDLRHNQMEPLQAMGETLAVATTPVHGDNLEWLFTVGAVDKHLWGAPLDKNSISFNTLARPFCYDFGTWPGGLDPSTNSLSATVFVDGGGTKMRVLARTVAGELVANVIDLDGVAQGWTLPGNQTDPFLGLQATLPDWQGFGNLTAGLFHDVGNNVNHIRVVLTSNPNLFWLLTL